MSTPNDNKRQQLISKLKELFQLDQPDLDFGLYRIMHAKSAEITQFLEKDLLPQVQAAFALYKTADKAEIEKELAKVIAGIEAAGMDPSQSPKVKELQAKLQSEAVDVGGLEGEVYDHLLSFFRRYYSEGDFLSRRVYKPGVYAIPYEGEEIKLHSANADQYYIKTSEYLRDYAFRLRQENDREPLRVHFRLSMWRRVSTATSRLPKEETGCSSWQVATRRDKDSSQKRGAAQEGNSLSASSTGLQLFRIGPTMPGLARLRAYP